MATITTDWGKYVPLTLDHTKVDATLTDFPLKVILNSSRATMSDMQDDGDDIRITKADGTILDFEKELFGGGDIDTDFEDDSYGLISDMDITGSGLSVSLSEDYSMSGDKSMKILHGSAFNGYATSTLTFLPKAGTSISFFVLVNRYATDDFKIYFGDYYINLRRQPEQDYDEQVHFGISGESTYYTGYDLTPQTQYKVEIDFLTSSSVKFSLKSADGETTHASHTFTDLTSISNSCNFNIQADGRSGTDITYIDNLEITNTKVVAIYHGKVPNVSSTSDTALRVYFKNDSATDGQNASAVWDSDYELVMHMDDSLEDSTSNGNDGTNSGSTSGMASNGCYRSFDGSNDYISFPDVFGGETHVNVLAHLNMDNNTGDKALIGQWSTNAQVLIYQDDPDGWRVLAKDSGNGFCISYQSDNKCTAGTDEVWSFDIPVNGNVKIYEDGSLVGSGDASSTTNAIRSDATTFRLGTDEDGTRDLTADVFEFRVSAAERSAAWIKATSYNLADSLLTYGTEVTVSTAHPWMQVVFI